MKTMLMILLYVLVGWAGKSINYTRNEHILTEKRVDCISPTSVNNDSLRSTLEKHIQKVKDYEIPFLVKQSKGDSTMYFLSSFIYTNSIVKNPPATINILGGREILCYDGQGKMSSVCQTAVVNKYRKILHMDKMNEEQGRPPGTPLYYLYSPVWVKVTIVGDKVVDVTQRQTEKTPFLNFSPD